MKKIGFICAIIIAWSGVALADQNIIINTGTGKTIHTCQQLTTHYVFGQATNTTCDAYVDIPVTPQVIVQQNNLQKNNGGVKEYYNPQLQQWQNTPIEPALNNQNITINTSQKTRIRHYGEPRQSDADTNTDTNVKTKTNNVNSN